MQTLAQSRTARSERTPNRRVDSRLPAQRHAEVLRLLDVFRAAHAAGQAPQHDGYVTRLMQRMQDGTLRVVDHVLVLARNWFERKAPREEVEAPFRACLAIIASWYPVDAPLDLHALSRAETIAEGPANVFQMDIDTLEGPALAAAERAIARDVAAGQRLLDAVRMKLYAVEFPPAA
jgi:hypothetical protein